MQIDDIILTPLRLPHLLPWPLVVIIDDGYNAEHAAYAIEAVRSFPEEAFSLLWGFAADKAREEVTRN